MPLNLPRRLQCAPVLSFADQVFTSLRNLRIIRAWPICPPGLSSKKLDQTDFPAFQIPIPSFSRLGSVPFALRPSRS